MKRESIIINAIYGKVSLGANIPITGDNDKVIGFTNGDGSVTITDPEMISLMEEKGIDVISFSYKEEKK